MRVLITLDGSAGSDAVVREAASRPWPAGTEFLVLTAIDPFFFTKAPLLLAEAKKDAEAALGESLESLRKNGLNLKTEIVLENPRHGIPKAACEWQADLILMGSHGRGTFGRLLMGSTAQAVLRRAHCAVEIVRAGTHRAGREDGGIRVLAATDGSECAEGALRAMVGQPWPAGTEIRVVCVPEVPLLTGAYPCYPPEVLAEAATANESHAKDAVAKGVEIIKKTGLRVTGEVTESQESPVRVILGMADLWGADLIVVGSHGRRGVDRYLMGSVSEAVALHAHCSVEVVRGK
ncbi:MAG TPA: universal stress protein [Candidatus Acidoferrum sp.]|nr:universal stress protein [Candidatus Acidoferrum sp.]